MEEPGTAAPSLGSSGTSIALVTCTTAPADGLVAESHGRGAAQVESFHGQLPGRALLQAPRLDPLDCRWSRAVAGRMIGSRVGLARAGCQQEDGCEGEKGFHGEFLVDSATPSRSR